MGKSRYSKTKAAGEAIGLTRYGKQFGERGNMVIGNNRAIRRMLGERKNRT